MRKKSIAITQPYIFPYINYFHLIEASDIIVFYDDINFIKSGWINKNRILLNNEPHTISIPIKKASQNIWSCDTYYSTDKKFKSKTLKSLEHAYSKAPYFNEIMEIICNTFSIDTDIISELAIESIKNTYKYLEKELSYCKSSILSPESRHLGKSDRLIYITKKLDADTYINVEWGKSIHKKQYFEHEQVSLQYLTSYASSYKQFTNLKIQNLSIIDCMMFTPKEMIKEFFIHYSLE